MTKFSIVLIIVLFASCKSDETGTIKSLRRDNYIIKGKTIRDSIFNDTMRYYDLNGSLISAKVYKEGIQVGTSVDYYSNGQPNIIAEYSDGRKNGVYTVLNTKGRTSYKGFFYYDLPVGPVVYYEDDGKPKRYFFVDLNDRDLLRIYYPEWNGIEDVVKNLINFSINTIKIDTTKEVSIFLYLLSPPRFSFEYSVVKIKADNTDSAKFVRGFKEKLPFVSFTLPILPDDQELYSIKLSIHDSVLNKQTIIYKDIHSD